MNRGNMGRLPSAVGNMLCLIRFTDTTTETRRTVKRGCGMYGLRLTSKARPEQQQQGHGFSF